MIIPPRGDLDGTGVDQSNSQFSLDRRDAGGRAELRIAHAAKTR